MTKSDKITKAHLLRELLQRESGASLAEICAATGWQAHSARAALTGIRKSGTVIERVAAKGGEQSRWRIILPATTATSGPDADVTPIDGGAPAEKTRIDAKGRSGAEAEA